MNGIAAAARARVRVRVRVRGIVQGVGFRPYVYRLAVEHALGGYVQNDSRGVLLEIEGTDAAIEAFLARLPREAPPLALVEGIERRQCAARDQIAFAILHSASEGSPQTPVTPDTATCDDCLRELFDPANRRFRYPFINCTNCGPRFTIVRGIPYDRPLTTMAPFEMCAACRAEYEDPADRRFHAQPNACARCGPSASLLGHDGRAPRGGSGDAVRDAAAALARGAIVAIKGIGGFHLACDAFQEDAVAALRARKRRREKPFALMVAELAAAEAFAQLRPLERELLRAPERPIVLIRRSDAAGSDARQLARSVAPGTRELGLMLPYTPLHHLLLRDFAQLRGGVSALVMTSGNVADEPIVFRDERALADLSPVAEAVLTHDRPIETRTDDSVLRPFCASGAERAVFLRRSRGYAPASLPLPHPAPSPILAVGAELKNTFCVAKDERAWVSHHIGDLENFEALRSFEDGIAHFKRLFDVQPLLIAHDLHPEYLSTKFARELEGARLEGVQHHHAHLAACLAEHDHEGTVVGAIFDGAGYGGDGTIWGGELLVGDAACARRAGMLMQVPLPGGAAAIREPWRMACAWLLACGAGDEVPRALARTVPAERWRQVAQLARSGLSPLTSSVGRLFDAVAAICGTCVRTSYEGQAAIELESACRHDERGAYEIAVRAERESSHQRESSHAHDAPRLILDPCDAIRAIAADARAGVDVGSIAMRFHAAIARATVRACAHVASAADTDTVVLSGGVFANRRLLEASAEGLGAAGLRVLVPTRLPLGDGGISYGQAVVAARRSALRAR